MASHCRPRVPVEQKPPTSIASGGFGDEEFWQRRPLPDRERLVLTLHRDEGLTFPEIARLLGVTTARVKQIYEVALGST